MRGKSSASEHEPARASMRQQELRAVNRKSYREGFGAERLTFLNISGNPDTSLKENLTPKKTLLRKSFVEGLKHFTGSISPW